MSKEKYKYVDDWASIRLADSFVKENKAGTGNGEACLYVGSIKNPEIIAFYGAEDFDVECIVLKNDLVDYLNSIKIEYIHHRFNYRNIVNEDSWQRNLNEVLMLPDEISFNLTRKRKNDKLGRIYAQDLSCHLKQNLSLEKHPKAYVYDLIRRISIPEVTCLLITKFDSDDGCQFLTKLYYDPDIE